MTHALKTWPEYYRAVIKDEKRFELRKADREFGIGDTLLLQEYDPGTKKYTGCEAQYIIDYILIGGSFGIKKGYVCMSISEKPNLI